MIQRLFFKQMTHRIARGTMTAICICWGLNAWGQEGNTESRRAEFGAELTSEFQVSGKGKCNFANLLKLGAEIPVMRNLSLEVSSLSTYMTSAESIGEEIQTFSNLDAENIPFTLAVCGFNWQMNDRHALFLGIRNMNEDYFASDVTAFFCNSSWGIYPTLSFNYPVANYPVSAIGVHYKYEKALRGEDALSVQASLYNGTGHYRFAGRENFFRVCPKSDGVFALTEVQYSHGASQYFLGNALYCNESTNATPWAYAEQSVGERTKIIAGASHAFGTDAECRDFIGVGAHYQAGSTELGVFTDYARFAEAKEWATELSCKYSVTQNISFQPSAHLFLTDNNFSCAFGIRLNLKVD